MYIWHVNISFKDKLEIFELYLNNSKSNLYNKQLPFFLLYNNVQT